MNQETVDQFINNEINIAISLALNQGGSTAKLNQCMPDLKSYPWEIFLELNFSKNYNPKVKPFALTIEDFDVNSEIQDTNKPKNIVDLLLFMEFLREKFDFIEGSIPLLEKKFMHFQFRAKQMLANSKVDKKELQKNIQNTLIEAHNIVSQRGALQDLYKKTTTFINTEIQSKGHCNIKRMYGLRIMEQEFNPSFKVLSRKSRELIFIQKKLIRILKTWQSIRTSPQEESV